MMNPTSVLELNPEQFFSWLICEDAPKNLVDFAIEGRLSARRFFMLNYRADWLMWMSSRLPEYSLQQLALSACVCVESTLLDHANHDAPRLALEMVRKWARGEATKSEVEYAARAVYYDGYTNARDVLFGPVNKTIRKAWRVDGAAIYTAGVCTHWDYRYCAVEAVRSSLFALEDDEFVINGAPRLTNTVHDGLCYLMRGILAAGITQPVGGEV